jgi:predicted transposase YbfD/YdcC
VDKWHAEATAQSQAQAGHLSMASPGEIETMSIDGTNELIDELFDVVFREDLARLRSGNAPANMAIVRHTALNLLSGAKPTTSFKNRRKKAGWNLDYLETVLRGTT